MKARHYDLELLNALHPLEVAAYLRSHGRQQVERIGDAGSVWTHASRNDEGFEVLLPYDRTYGDYLPRLADLLGTLEVAEERPQPAIINDLLVSQVHLTSDTVPVLKEAARVFRLGSCSYLDHSSYKP